MIKFKKDQSLCYDGINVRHYKAGEFYAPTHPHEEKVFQAFIDDGRGEECKVKEEMKVSQPKKTKIRKPKSSK